MATPSGQALEKTHAAVTGDRSALARYRSVIVGRPGFLNLLYFEWCTWLSPIPGALGLLLRKLFWPRLFGSCGKKVHFGANVTLMHPRRIHIGDGSVVGNGCILDARHADSERVIVLGEDVVLSHGVMIACKDGSVTLGRSVGIGTYTVIHSTTQSPVHIGDHAMVASHCYILGGGDYNMDRLDVPIAQQGLRATGETRVEEGVWLGAHVTLVGGASVGKHSVVGAGSVVVKPLPAMAVCVGAPARVMRLRTAGDGG
jgi:acetyltransferase-like isoleucine patch superfamily enzyme